MSPSRWVIGFGPVIVPPGERREIEVPLQKVRVRIDGLYVTGDGIDLHLVDVVIAEKSQLTGPVPLLVFPRGALHEVQFDVIPPDTHVRVVVENRGRVPRKFGLNLLGDVVAEAA